MLSLLPPALALGLAALAALHLALSRSSPPERVAARRAAALALAAAVVFQCAHFAEEAATGFNARLGGVFGLGAIPLPSFIGFNLAWLAIWIASVPGVCSGNSIALFAAWFLAIAGMLNGVAHPLLAVAAGGYFPGLYTAPVVGAVCLWLWIRLRQATRPRDHGQDGRVV